jgi:hypothetical protein
MLRQTKNSLDLLAGRQPKLCAFRWVPGTVTSRATSPTRATAQVASNCALASSSVGAWSFVCTLGGLPTTPYSPDDDDFAGRRSRRAAVQRDGGASNLPTDHARGRASPAAAWDLQTTTATTKIQPIRASTPTTVPPARKAGMVVVKNIWLVTCQSRIAFIGGSLRSSKTSPTRPSAGNLAPIGELFQRCPRTEEGPQNVAWKPIFSAHGRTAQMGRRALGESGPVFLIRLA